MQPASRARRQVWQQATRQPETRGQRATGPSAGRPHGQTFVWSASQGPTSQAAKQPASLLVSQPASQPANQPESIEATPASYRPRPLSHNPSRPTARTYLSLSLSLFLRVCVHHPSFLSWPLVVDDDRRGGERREASNIAIVGRVRQAIRHAVGQQVNPPTRNPVSSCRESG